jgi:hypothetical protein
MTVALLVIGTLLLGIVGGGMLLAIVGWALPSLFLNLGMHGTLLSAISTAVVMIPWIYRDVSRRSSHTRSISLMLARGFVIAIAFRVIFEVFFAVFGAPSPEQMTWGGEVIIDGGRRTALGWRLVAQGVLESGLAGLILCGAVALTSDLVGRLRRIGEP